MQPGFHIILHVAYLPLTGENIKLDRPIRATRGKERNTKWGLAGHLEKKKSQILERIRFGYCLTPYLAV